jgi:hypothetical protein
MCRFVVSLVVLLFVTACGGAPATQSVSDQLNGTWQSDVFTVTIDFNNGTYKGVALGQPFDRKLTLVEEQANTARFKADDIDVVAQLQEDGSLILTRDGGIPVVLQRAP